MAVIDAIIVNVWPGRTNTVLLTQFPAGFDNDFCPHDTGLVGIGSTLAGYTSVTHWQLVDNECYYPPLIVHMEGCILGSSVQTTRITDAPTSAPWNSPGTGGTVVTGDYTTEMDITIPANWPAWQGIAAFNNYPLNAPDGGTYAFFRTNVYTTSCTVGLNTTFYYQSYGGWLRFAEGDPQQDAPDGFDAECVDSEIVVSWEPPAFLLGRILDHYELYRDGVLIYAGTETSFIDSDIEGEETYTYKVRVVVYEVVDGVNIYSYSDFTEGIVAGCGGCDTPAAPVAAGVSECCGKHNILTWSAVEDADGYRVYSGSVVLYDGSLLTYTRNLTSSQRKEDQTYIVRAYNDCGESAGDTVTVRRYLRRSTDPATAYGRASDPACANTRVAGPTTVYRREGCG